MRVTETTVQALDNSWDAETITRPPRESLRRKKSSDRFRSWAQTSSAEAHANADARNSTPPAAIMSNRDQVSAHASRIRSRFLNRLGFEPRRSGFGKYTMRRAVSSRPRSCSFQQDLKDPDDEDSSCCHSESNAHSHALIHSFMKGLSSLSLEESTEAESDSEATPACSAATSRPSNRSVSFDASVTVVPIPLHSEYSDRIRHTLWSSPSEMELGVARNCFEYAAEGWTPEGVVDEDDMVTWEGELIHPIHFFTQQARPVRQTRRLR